MRIELSFMVNKVLRLPKSYNHIIQGFIYSHLKPTLARLLHYKGFRYEKRRFRLFTFSRVLGRVRELSDCFEFIPPFRLVISSPRSEILQSLAENLIKKEIFLNGQRVFVQSVTVHFVPEFGDKVIIKALSPITVYSTLLSPDGRKKTYYYSPFEEEFSILIKRNLFKKYELVFGKKLKPDFDFDIKPKRVSKRDQQIIIYMGTVIKGWLGVYTISGSPDLIRVAYDCGLGSKNSQGFGCFEIINNKLYYL